MAIDGNTRDEKLRFNINREAANIPALSSGKIDKYEFRAVEEILLLDQRKAIEQAKFPFFPSGKAFFFKQKNKKKTKQSKSKPKNKSMLLQTKTKD